MIKVCHLTSVHNAKDGRIFKKQCCSLAKAGYDVYLIAPAAHSEDIIWSEDRRSSWGKEGTFISDVLFDKSCL